MAWFRPIGTLTAESFIVKHEAFYVGFGEQHQLKFGLHPDDVSVESTNSLRNRWYHFAVTFDGETMKIYINGQLNNEMPHDGLIALATADLVICQGFSGSIDELRIYNTTLPEDKIEDVAYTGGLD